MSRVVRGYRVELRPTVEQRRRLGQHAGLSRVVENFCLDQIRAAFAQREAERSYSIPEHELTKAPWSAVDLEKLWRRAHRDVFPWFTAEKLSSRIPKEACRVRAAGLRNWVDSRKGARKGRRVGFPKLRKRKHGSRFRYDADRARPTGTRTVALPAVGAVATGEDMSWLVERIGDGRARVIGATVREQAGRWWVSFQVEVDRTDINRRRTVGGDAPTCGIDLGVKTFAVIADDTGSVDEVHAPKPLKTALRKLRKADKALARCQRGSGNRVKLPVRSPLCT